MSRELQERQDEMLRAIQESKIKVKKEYDEMFARSLEKEKRTQAKLDYFWAKMKEMQ